MVLLVQHPTNVTQANTRLSPLPHEPLNSGANDATVDIPLGGVKVGCGSYVDFLLVMCFGSFVVSSLISRAAICHHVHLEMILREITVLFTLCRMQFAGTKKEGERADQERRRVEEEGGGTIRALPTET